MDIRINYGFLLKSKVTLAKNLVFAEFQWFNFSLYCSDVVM